MKLKFTYLNFLLAVLLFSQGLFAQTNDGDYISNGTGGGTWGTPGTWLLYSGGVASPTLTSPTTTAFITIQGTDLVTLDVDATVNMIHVVAGATLKIDNSVTTTNTLTLGGATPNSLIVDGALLLGGNDVLLGSGSNGVVVNSGGVMNWESGSFIEAIDTIKAGGILNISNNDTKFLQSATGTATIVNNGITNWATGGTGGGILLQNGRFINNGTLNEQFQSIRGWADNGGTNSIINNGVLNKTTAFPLANFGAPFTNAGTIQGMGSLNLNGTIVNSGLIQAGTPTGSVVANFGITNSAIAVSNFPTLGTTIASSGDVLGTNYDQVIVTDVSGTVDLTKVNLTINEPSTTTDAVGTNYVILSVPNGATISGQFNHLTLPADISQTLSYTLTTVTASKIVPLPLTWGPFDAFGEANNTVLLDWTTFMESNTSHFSVEYSSNGKDFASVGAVAAAGNSSTASHYSFTHSSPQLNGNNYYRLLEVDLDGTPSYSPTRVVRFSEGKIVKLLASPNPAHDLLQLNAQEQGISAILTDASGKALRTWILQQGTQQMNISNLPAGMYQLIIYQNQQKIDTQHILKF
jgi:hypothetical protein